MVPCTFLHVEKPLQIVSLGSGMSQGGESENKGLRPDFEQSRPPKISGRYTCKKTF